VEEHASGINVGHLQLEAFTQAQAARMMVVRARR
jgi:hypothetical protein